MSGEINFIKRVFIDEIFLKYLFPNWCVDTCNHSIFPKSNDIDWQVCHVSSSHFSSTSVKLSLSSYIHVQSLINKYSYLIWYLTLNRSILVLVSRTWWHVIDRLIFQILFRIWKHISIHTWMYTMIIIFMNLLFSFAYVHVLHRQVNIDSCRISPAKPYSQSIGAVRVCA
jgi:hypothetical protein